MIEKIVVSQDCALSKAVLSTAATLGLATGGWSHSNTHSLNEAYGVQPVAEGAGLSALEQTVADSHGTLCFTAGQHALRSVPLEAIKQSALRLKRPFLVVRLGRENAFAVSRRLAEWLEENEITVLHVSGEIDEQEDRSASAAIAGILEATVYLSMMRPESPSALATTVNPETVEAALVHLEEALPLKDRATIANLAIHELVALEQTVGSYIRRNFGLFTADSSLLADCCRCAATDAMTPDDAVNWMIRELWERLRANCRIRIVK